MTQEQLFDPIGLATADKRVLPEPPKITTASIIARVVIPGVPMSKQRPRFVRKTGAVFTPKETRDREHQIGQYVWAKGWRRPPDPESAFGIRAVFYVADQQRKDTDNMLKLVLDGLNGVVWKDDCQVFEVMGWKREDATNPRTELVVYTLGFAAKHMEECQHCKKRYRQYPSWTRRKFCSAKCSRLAAMTGEQVSCASCSAYVYRPAAVIAASRRGQFFCSTKCLSAALTVELTCAQCRASFRKPRSQVRGPVTMRRFCSQDCQREAARLSGATTARRYGPCEICGNGVSRKEYRRCGACRDFRGRRSAIGSGAS